MIKKSALILISALTLNSLIASVTRVTMAPSIGPPYLQTIQAAAVA